MKLQIDTKERTITLDEDVLLEDLIITLDRLFPNQEWRGFTLLNKTIINWSSPIYIPPYQTPSTPQPLQPWYNVTSNESETHFQAGVYNVEC